MPPLAEFGSEGINPVALAQQAALITDCYMHDRECVEKLLGDGGEILNFHTENLTWPPDYVLIRSLPGRYFLSMAGTVGPVQAVAQSALSNAVVSQGKGGAYTGGLWWAAANTIEQAVKDLIPFDEPDTRVFVAGHSYGGMVAQLLALRYARKLGAARVQLLTLGAPKGLSPGYTGAYPSVSWRVYSNNDAIPFLFLDNPGLIIVDPTQPWTWENISMQWQHYGTDARLDVNGVIGGTADDANPRPPDVLSGTLAEHSLQNYLGRARQYALKNGASPVALAAVEAGLKCFHQLPPEAYREAWNPNDLGLPPEVIPDLISKLNLYGALKGPGGIGVALQKHTLIFTGPDSEYWTETYMKEGSSDPDTEVNLIPQTLLDLRLEMLHKSFKLRAVRVANVNVPKGTALRLIQKDGTHTNAEANPGPDAAGLTAVHELVAINGAKRRIWFRGYPDAVIERQQNGGDVGAGKLGDKTKAWLTALATAGYGIPKRRKAGEVDNVQKRFASRVDGSITAGQALIYLDTTVGLAVGDQVSLSQFNKKDLPGLEGLYDVLKVSDGIGIYVRYTTSDFRNVANAPGVVRKIVLQPVSQFNVAKCKMTHIGTRKTSRRFTGSRGASRAARIRNLD